MHDFQYYQPNEVELTTNIEQTILNSYSKALNEKNKYELSDEEIKQLKYLYRKTYWKTFLLDKAFFEYALPLMIWGWAFSLLAAQTARYLYAYINLVL